MNERELNDIIKMAISEKPTVRNPAFYVVLYSGKKHYCEISQEIPGGPIALFGGGEPIIVSEKDIKKVRLVSQIELIRASNFGTRLR